MQEDLIIKVDEALECGQGRAKKGRVIADLCNSSDREVRVVIRSLIASGVPVASSTNSTHGGFYIANTREEAEVYLLKMRSRVIENCKRMRDFKRSAKPLLYPGQLPLI